MCTSLSSPKTHACPAASPPGVRHVCVGSLYLHVAVQTQHGLQFCNSQDERQGQQRIAQEVPKSGRRQRHEVSRRVEEVSCSSTALRQGLRSDAEGGSNIQEVQQVEVLRVRRAGQSLKESEVDWPLRGAGCEGRDSRRGVHKKRLAGTQPR